MNKATDDGSAGVWIIEDDSEYRETLTYLLNHTSDLRCTRVFTSYEEVHTLMGESTSWDAPDIVLVDISLPGIDGIQGTAQLKAVLPAVPILMLTHKDDPEVIFKALSAGASGYLLKESAVEETLTAIREAIRGGMFIPAPVAEKVRRFFMSVGPVRDYGLTSREHEILHLMAEGKAQKEIALELSISPHTVDNHLRSIYRKLEVNSNLEAIAKAYRERLL